MIKKPKGTISKKTTCFFWGNKSALHANARGVDKPTQNCVLSAPSVLCTFRVQPACPFYNKKGSAFQYRIPLEAWKPNRLLGSCSGHSCAPAADIAVFAPSGIDFMYINMNRSVHQPEGPPLTTELPIPFPPPSQPTIQQIKALSQTSTLLFCFVWGLLGPKKKAKP